MMTSKLSVKFFHLLSTSVFITLISCEENKPTAVKENTPFDIVISENGDSLKVTYFTNNGSIKQSSKLKNGLLQGLQINYYENGNISSKGLINNHLKEGKWQYYDENKNLKFVREHIIVDSKSEINQEWIFNETTGDTLMEKSTFYRTELFKDTIQMGDINALAIYLAAPYFKNTDQMLVVTGNFDKYFNNIAKVEKDTAIVEGLFFSHRFIPQDTGNNHIRLIVIEIDEEGNNSSFYGRNIYVEQSYYVLPKEE